MDYVIIECRETVELVRWGGPRYEVWSPTFMDTKIVGKGQNARKVAVRRPALPGYAFVPRFNWPEMRRRVHEKFNVRVVEYDLLGRPRCCTLADLQAMDEILKAEQNRLVAVKEGEDAVVKFKRGDEVEVFVGPFAGRTGVVQCSGEKPIIRLLMGVRYVNLPRAMLKIAVDAAK